MNRFAGMNPAEQSFHEWSRVQNYLTAINQMAVSTERVLLYRELSKAVCAHYEGQDESACPGFVAIARTLIHE